MNHVYFFQWNIPADNHLAGDTDGYINILASWNGNSYSSGKPIVYATPVNLSLWDCMKVINWRIASDQIEAIAENHFEALARQERINKARAELIAEGEIIENPVLARYEANVLPEPINDLPY